MATTRTFDDEVTYTEDDNASRYGRTYQHALQGMCRESDIGKAITSPEVAREIFRPMMLADRETLAVMLLDASRRVIVAFVAATGTATQVACNPASIYRPAIVLGASYVLIAHNHPDGNPTPSDADLTTTRMLEAGAMVLGIGFVDHLVLTSGARYQSIAAYMDEHGLNGRI